MSVTGFRTASDGAVVNQTQLLQDIADGLAVYNANPQPLLTKYCYETFREVDRVPQAPFTAKKHVEGATPIPSEGQFRQLSTPLDGYDISDAFTLLGFQDALQSDLEAHFNMAMAADADLMIGLMLQAALTKRTAGSIGTAYRAGFANGETDLPFFGENTFSSAHSHYAGLNTTTFAPSQVQAMVEDITEHGYGLMPDTLELFINQAQFSDVTGAFDTNGANTVLQVPTTERMKLIDRGLFGTGFGYVGVRITVNPYIPAGYLLMMASDVKPLHWRQHYDAQYRGLMRINNKELTDAPLIGSWFFRRAGFSGRHLCAGAARQLVASTTYTNPTFRIGAN